MFCMFCSRCGARHTEGAQFCARCGAPAARAASAPPKVRPATEAEEADLAAQLTQAWVNHSTESVTRRAREAFDGIGRDGIGALRAIAQTPEAQALLGRVALIDAATGGSIARSARLLGEVIKGRKRIP